MKKTIIRLGQFALGSIGAAILNFLTVPLITFFISPEEYGKTSMFMLLQTMLLSFIYLGFDQAYNREFYERDDRRQLFLTALIVPIVFSGVLIAGLILFASDISYFLFLDRQYTGVIYLLAGSIIFLVLERFLFMHLRMEQKALEYATFNVLIKFLILLSIFIGLTIVRPTFISVIAAMILGQMLGDLCLVIRNIRLLSLKSFRLDVPLLKKMSRFAFPVVIATFFYTLFFVIDKLFLRYYSSYEQLGLYTAAFKIASALLIIQNVFANLWISTATKWYLEKRKMADFKFVSDGMMLMVSVLLVALLIGKHWLVSLFPADYADTAYIFPFLCFYPLMMTVSETTNLGIAFTRKSYLNIFASILTLLFAVGIDYCLVPRFGAIGAAMGTGCSYIVFFMARTFFSKLVWKGFAVKRHFVVIFILVVVVFLNVWVRQPLPVLLLNLGTLLLLGFIYRDLIKQAKIFWKEQRNLNEK